MFEATVMSTNLKVNTLVFHLEGLLQNRARYIQCILQNRARYLQCIL